MQCSIEVCLIQAVNVEREYVSPYTLGFFQRIYVMVTFRTNIGVPAVILHFPQTKAGKAVYIRTLLISI